MKWLPSLVAFLLVGGALTLALEGCGSPSRYDQYVKSVEARDFLTLPVVVEVVSVQQRSPSPMALGLIAARISEQGAGPPTFVASQVLDARRSWSDRELHDFEHTHEKVPGRAARLFVAYLGGTYSSANASGVQYGSHGIAMFLDVTGGPEREARALVHELGHVIGLVNDAARADRFHPFHDPDPRCVMFWTLNLPGLGGSDFCGACKVDLARTRGS